MVGMRHLGLSLAEQEACWPVAAVLLEARGRQRHTVPSRPRRLQMSTNVI